MAKAPLFNSTGTKQKDVTLPKAIFAASVNPLLLAQALHVYRANLHQSTSKVKTRGEVARTTAKWFRQKGTGRARHGARSAPIFVGGGVAHGPTGLKPAKKHLPVKVARLALRAALTAQADSVTLISGLDKVKPQTAKLDKLLSKLKLSQTTLAVTAANYPSFKKAAQNIAHLSILPVNTLNAYQVLKPRHLLIDQDALDKLQSWLVPSKQKS